MTYTKVIALLDC